MSSEAQAPSIPPTKLTAPPTILCVASFFKGNDFLDECKKQGCKVLLLTLESLLGKPWVRESIDEVFALPERFADADRRAVINTVAYLRGPRLDRIAPLDDFDVEIGGATSASTCASPAWARRPRATSATSSRCACARATAASPSPSSSTSLNDDAIRDFLARVPAARGC